MSRRKAQNAKVKACIKQENDSCKCTDICLQLVILFRSIKKVGI